jgi:hypothetical protein
MLKRLLLPALQSLAAAGILACLPGAASAFSPTHLMDDGVFDNNVTMGQPQIQAMVDGTDGKLPAPSACLRTYQTPNFFFDGTVWHYGDITTTDTTDPNYSHRWNVSYGPSMILASQAIYQSAHQWGMNPQVLIATLEKEESLVAGTSCDAWRYNSVTGARTQEAATPNMLDSRGKFCGRDGNLNSAKNGLWATPLGTATAILPTWAI